jgi:hypothetical protein
MANDCSAVVCVIGKRSGDLPPPAAAEPFKHMLPPGIAAASYAQWEFFFARHFKRRLSIYIANDYEADLDPTSEDDPALQKAFLDHIVETLGLYRTPFSNAAQLRIAVLKEDWPQKPGLKKWKAGIVIAIGICGLFISINIWRMSAPMMPNPDIRQPELSPSQRSEESDYLDAESTNRQILLNAVRAAQRAPMSFSSSVARRLQRHLTAEDVRYFVDLKLPKELLQILFVREYTVAARQRQKIASDFSARCINAQDERTSQFCMQLGHDRDAFKAAGCRDFTEPRTGNVTILNMARDICSMTVFQMFERQLRLLNLDLPFQPRTGQETLSYLGELIAAQIYSPYPFTPKFFTVTLDGQRRTVPIFEVRRGAPAPGEATVTVSQF